ncbi:Sigma factor AlgU negative regulatory protein [compost metagenome]
MLAGVRLYNQDEVAGTQQLAQQQASQPAMAMPQAQQGAVLAGYSEDAQQPIGATQSSSGWHEKRLPAYLRQHAQQAAMSGSDSALPYARAASLESR